MSEQIPQAVYKQDLEIGRFEAFSLDPRINNEGLVGIVNDLGRKRKPSQELIDGVIRTDSVHWINGLDIEILRNPDGSVKNYRVPAPLQKYRDAIGEAWEKSGKFNGPVMIPEGEIRNPLRVMQGGYFDFAATRLKEEPAKLAPADYAPGKNVEQILKETGFWPESRARYFGFMHLMWPSNGKEFLLVQRAKGMGIAADCLATPGSTPDLVLNSPSIALRNPGFDINGYWSYHFTEEMKDEFALKFGDFWIDKIGLYDDANMTPFGAVNIYTQMSVKQIAEGVYNAKPEIRNRVLKEHDVMFSMPVEAVPSFIERFPLFHSIYAPVKHSLKEKGISK